MEFILEKYGDFNTFSQYYPQTTHISLDCDNRLYMSKVAIFVENRDLKVRHPVTEFVG